MAEIHVQTKKQSTSNPLWIWIIIAFLVVAAIAWLVLKNKETAPAQTPAPVNPASQVPGVSDYNGQYMLA